jgi:hypothetical protein
MREAVDANWIHLVGNSRHPVTDCPIYKAWLEGYGTVACAICDPDVANSVRCYSPHIKLGFAVAILPERYLFDLLGG